MSARDGLKGSAVPRSMNMQDMHILAHSTGRHTIGARAIVNGGIQPVAQRIVSSFGTGRLYS